MQKRQGASTEPQFNDPPAERMQRPPARRDAAPTVHRPAPPPAEAPSGHPVFAHHDRVSAAHAEFLRNQERVHLEFLAHRERLLAWLREAGQQQPSRWRPSPLSPSPTTRPRRSTRSHGDARSGCSSTGPPSPRGPSRSSRRAVQPKAEPEPMQRETQSLAVGWNDWLLDSHVLPVGVLFSALGALGRSPSQTSTPTGVGVLECELRGLGGLPGPGDTVVTELSVARSAKGLGGDPVPARSAPS